MAVAPTPIALVAAPPPRRRHVDTRLVTGVVLLAISVLGGLRLLAAADTTVAVVAAARDLPANHVVAPGDLTTTRIHAGSDVLAGLVAGADVPHLMGRVLLDSVGRHELVA